MWGFGVKMLVNMGQLVRGVLPFDFALLPC